MIPEFEAECVKAAQTRDIKLPLKWSAQALLEELRKEMLDVQDVVIKMAASLHQNGFQNPYLYALNMIFIQQVYFYTSKAYCI